MQQSNASGYNLLNLGGGAEFKQNVMGIMSDLNTGELVEVTAVDSSGNSPVGFVSVKVLTLRANADNKNVQLGEIHNVPYFRLQGGANAVIVDPEVGDIGFCGFCSRDTSIVKRIRAMAPQSVYRTSDISDAFFFGGWSSKAPEQYIWFDGDNVRIKATAKVIIDAPMTEVEQNMLIKGSLVTTGTITSQTNVIDPKGSMDKMRTEYNSHTHPENGQGNNTSTPNQPMG